MKKLILSILLIIISVLGFAQTFPIITPIGSKPTMLNNQGTFKAPGYTYASFTDTTEANASSYLKFTPGIIILTGYTNLWVRNSAATAWVQISGSGGGGGFTTANNGLTAASSTLIQLGGTLLKNTSIDAAGFTFGMSNASSIDLNIAGGGKLYMISPYYTSLSSGISGGRVSNVTLTSDSMTLTAQDGAINVPALRKGHFSTDSIVSWNSATGALGYVNKSDIGGITSANNGLTPSSSLIQLGGSLVKSTTVDGSSFPFYMKGFDSTSWKQSNTWALPDTMYGVGHSFIALGSEATSYNLSILPLSASSYNLPYVNMGQSGAGMVTENQIFNVRRQPGGRGMVLMFGYDNDIRRNAGNRFMLNKLVQGTLSIFTNANLKSFVQAGSSSVTRSGTWTTGVNANAQGGKTTNGATTITANDSLVYQFSGENSLAIGLIIYDSVNLAGARGTIIIYNANTPTDIAVNTTFGTNQRTDGVSDGINSNQRAPGALIFTGLNPTKTYKLKIISNQSTNTLFIDYIGHLVDPSYAYPFITFNAVKMTTAGYTSFGGSDANINAANVIIDSIVAALSGLGYPVYSVASNTYYNPATGAGSDGFHPSNTGYSQLSTAIVSTFPSLNIPSNAAIHNNNNSLWTSVNRKPLQIGSTPGNGIVAKENIWSNSVLTGYPGGQTWQFGQFTGEGGRIVSNPLLNGIINIGQNNALTVNESTGYIGINDISPEAQLKIIGNGAANVMQIDANASSGDLLRYYASDASTNRFRVSWEGGLQVFGSLSARVPQLSAELYVNGTDIAFGAYDGSSIRDMRIYSGNLKFETTSAGTTDIRMTGGKMYIGGTGTPEQTLQVNGQIKINSINNASVFDSVIVINNGIFEARLASSIIGATPTLDAVFLAESRTAVMVANNIVNLSGNDFTFNGFGHFKVTNRITFDVTSNPLTIIGLTNLTTGDRLIGQVASSSVAGYITIGTGLSLSSGVLSATGGSGTVTSVSFTGGLISVGTPTTTPAFTVAGTSGGIPYFSSTSTWASSALLTANAIMIGGGAGATPATTTTGTGVLTALGVNVGSAGAFVTFNGALGTPSSGTLTNATGYLWNNIASPTGTQTLSWPDASLNAWTNGSNTETFTTITSNSLTTGIVLSMTSNSQTYGNFENYNSTSTAKVTGNALSIHTSSGANATASVTNLGDSINITNTGTTATNIAMKLGASGAPTANIALQTFAGNVLIGAPTNNTVDGLIIQSPTNTAGQGLRVYANNNSTYTELGYGAILNPGGFAIQSSSATIINLVGSTTYIGAATTATSTLQTLSFAPGYVAKTGTYTATISDCIINCTANTFTVTLPTAVGITGRIYYVVNSGAGTITVGTTSSQTFTNVAGTPTTLTMATVGTSCVASDGANWVRLSSL